MADDQPMTTAEAMSRMSRGLMTPDEFRAHMGAAREAAGSEDQHEANKFAAIALLQRRGEVR